MSAAYAANPGELAPVHLLGGTVPDVAKLCQCLAADPERHVKDLNAEVVRKLVEAVQDARRSQASYLAVVDGWKTPIHTPPSVKPENKAMEFQAPA